MPASSPRMAGSFRNNNICVQTENLRSNLQIYDDIYAYINISVCSFECSICYICKMRKRKSEKTGMEWNAAMNLVENRVYSYMQWLLLWWNIFNCNCDIPVGFNSEFVHTFQCIRPNNPSGFLFVSFPLCISNEFHIVWIRNEYTHIIYIYIEIQKPLCTMNWKFTFRMRAAFKTTIHKFICGTVLPKVSFYLPYSFALILSVRELCTWCIRFVEEPPTRTTIIQAQ